MFNFKIKENAQIPFGFSYSNEFGRKRIYFKLPIWISKIDNYHPELDEIVFGWHFEAILVSLTVAHGKQEIGKQIYKGRA